ncbi:MAG TPA: galactokinase, partial [Cyclobacteriaceae bacterium]|nr:galactokinase [Cyclobacteriaceae bacterium]
IDFGAYRILLIDTKVKHALGSSAYNERRTACETGVRELQKMNPNVQSLRDVSLDQLEKIRAQLPDDVFVKCRFVISEIARTQQAAQVLKSGNMQAFGQLMYETHWGLSRDYEVSCEESDFLVSHAHQFTQDVLGARQMGGGFGGCVIHLINESCIEKYSSQVRAKYVATFKKEPGFYSVSFTKGVHTL